MDLPTVNGLLEAWAENPPPAVSLRRIEAMIAAWLGVKPKAKGEERQKTEDEALAELMRVMPERKAQRILTREEWERGDWKLKSE